MKQNLQRYRIWIPTTPVRHLTKILAAGMLLASATEVAKGDDKSGSTQVRPANYDLEISDGGLVLDGTKTEATLANVVEVLRTRYQQANIVIAPGLAKLKIADLKLRAGQLADELEAVRVASGGKFEVIRPAPAAAIDAKTGLPLVRGKR